MRQELALNATCCPARRRKPGKGPPGSSEKFVRLLAAYTVGLGERRVGCIGVITRALSECHSSAALIPRSDSDWFHHDDRRGEESNWESLMAARRSHFENLIQLPARFLVDASCLWSVGGEGERRCGGLPSNDGCGLRWVDRLLTLHPLPVRVRPSVRRHR